jgi:hypothetical protein
MTFIYLPEIPQQKGIRQKLQYCGDLHRIPPVGLEAALHLRSPSDNILN